MGKIMERQFRQWLKQRQRYRHEVISEWFDMVKHVPLDGGFPKCEDINYKMRMILIDWLYDVTKARRYSMKTLHDTIHLADQYLVENLDLSRTKYQAVGIASMIIASDIHENVMMKCDYASHLCDGAYSAKELECMRKKILGMIATSGIPRYEFSNVMTFDDMYYVIYSPRFIGSDEANYFFEALPVIKRFIKHIRKVVHQRNQLFCQFVEKRYCRNIMLNVKEWIDGPKN